MNVSLLVGQCVLLALGECAARHDANCGICEGQSTTCWFPFGGKQALEPMPLERRIVGKILARRQDDVIVGQANKANALDSALTLEFPSRCPVRIVSFVEADRICEVQKGDPWPWTSELARSERPLHSLGIRYER